MTNNRVLTASVAALIGAAALAQPFYASSATATTLAPTLHAQGTVRCVSGTWQVLDDAVHTPYNLGTPTDLGNRLRVPYGTAMAVVSKGESDPDDTYVNNDIDAGASVGLTYMDIYFTNNGTPVNTSGLCISGSNVWVEAWEAAE